MKEARIQNERLTAVFLFIIFSTIYLATASGITSSNDGSHYALARTMVENRHFSLDQFDDYAEGNDIALRDGVLYSDRPPGTAVTMALFYVAAAPLPEPLTPIPSRHDAENARLLYVLFLPALAGTGTIVLLYLLLRRQGVTGGAAVLATVLFGLGTTHWKYSSVLFSHALSSFVVLLVVSLALHLSRNSTAHWSRWALLGFVSGYAVLVEYANGLLVILAGALLLWALRPVSLPRLARTLLPFVLTGLLPAAFLAYYNYVNFGSPLTLSYSFALNYPWAGEFSSTFSTPLWQGLQAMLYFGEGGGWCGGPCFNQGLFLLSPVLLLALPGFWWYGRRQPRAFLFTTAVFLVYLLLFARHHTSHGFTGDGRYLVPFLGLLALPLGHFLDWLYAQRRRRWAVLLEAVVYALFFLSLRNMTLHIGTSYNYFLDLSQLHPMVAHPNNWVYLARQIFPNAGNVPLLWLVESVGLLLWWGWRRWRVTRLPGTAVS